MSWPCTQKRQLRVSATKISTPAQSASRHPELSGSGKDLVDLFDSMDGRKVFLYSCRTAEEIFLSRASLGWSDDVPSFLTKLKSSLSSIIEFKDKISNDGSSDWIIHAVHLNSYISSKNRGEWLVDNVYSLIAPSVTVEEAEAYAAATSNRNATVKVTGQDRRNTLTSVERTAFERDRELMDRLEQFNDAFGVKVSVFADRRD
jgi:hypothetical protein